jgi:hypothetical protein
MNVMWLCVLCYFSGRVQETVSLFNDVRFHNAVISSYCGYGVVISEQSELEGVWKETFASYFQMFLKRPLERTKCGWRVELK